MAVLAGNLSVLQLPGPAMHRSKKLYIRDLQEIQNCTCGSGLQVGMRPFGPRRGERHVYISVILLIHHQNKNIFHHKYGTCRLLLWKMLDFIWRLISLPFLTFGGEISECFGQNMYVLISLEKFYHVKNLSVCYKKPYWTNTYFFL